MHGGNLARRPTRLMAGRPSAGTPNKRLDGVPAHGTLRRPGGPRSCLPKANREPYNEPHPDESGGQATWPSLGTSTRSCPARRWRRPSIPTRWRIPPSAERPRPWTTAAPPKVVLCDDARVRPGLPCLVKIKAVHKKEREDRGYIEADLVRQQEFKIEGVYLDPVASKKLQVMLESGMNILLDGPQGCGKTVLARAIAAALRMEFVFFNCGAVVEATDFLATIQVRASTTGAPVTRLRQDRSTAGPGAGRAEAAHALSGLLRRVQPLPGERPQRAHARARLHATHLPSHRQPLPRHTGQRPVHRCRQPGQPVLGHLRHRRGRSWTASRRCRSTIRPARKR